MNSIIDANPLISVPSAKQAPGKQKRLSSSIDNQWFSIDTRLKTNEPINPKNRGESWRAIIFGNRFLRISIYTRYFAIPIQQGFSPCSGIPLSRGASMTDRRFD